MKVIWLCCIFWLPSPLGVGWVVTAATAASRVESCKGSRAWICLWCFHRCLTMIKEVKYTPLHWPSATPPPHPWQHATRAIATELASYHVTIDPFHPPPSAEETDGSYTKPAMKKNENVYGHSLYTHVLKSQLHAKCWGYKDRGHFFSRTLKRRRGDKKEKAPLQSGLSVMIEGSPGAMNA